MRWPLLSIAMVTAMIAGCASGAAAPSSSPLPSAIASPEIVCDTAQFQPTPSLTCVPAITAALAGLDPGHPAIIRETFRWGGLCPAGAPCAPPLGGDGIVIFDFVGGPPVFVYVSADAAGAVTASSPAPLPSGY